MPKSRDQFSKVTPPKLSDDGQRIIEARHHDPFVYLGRHPDGKGQVSIRAFLPQTVSARLVELDAALSRVAGTDLFEWHGNENGVPDHYRIEWTDNHGNSHISYDPYCLPPCLSDFDIYLFSEGRHHHAAGFLGSRPHEHAGIKGILFATWAPSAERVSVVGDFNQWDGRRHPMRVRGSSGLWELFIPGLTPGMLYKFEIRNSRHGSLHVKTDPYGRCFELRPKTASVVMSDSEYDWQDQQWLEQRSSSAWLNRPMSIYEVHLGSWQLKENGDFLGYRELAPQLIDHVKALGFTHIELLPITEHPLDASWGYQTTGYFAPTSRFGTPDDFRFFVDYCHQHGIGVILDWVPGHFPRDSHGLARFDGSAVYEHEDPRRGEHRDWGTLIFNYGRNEVRNFLLSSALYWLEEYHLDGLRVDAVASMIYLDYSRSEGDWIPNMYGGNENLEALAFLREMNELTHQQCPGTVVIAEESTAWPMVSRPTWLGGLGFSMKWNMGWMHDTLSYMSQDPVYRHYHHDMLTFSQLYAYTENFVLPFSHDEVVHGKRSILYRMPGDEWQQFANLRLLYAYMFTHPGKKLLFMGCEFGQGQEWDHTKALDWYVLDYPYHQGVQTLVRDLNHLYHEHPALYQYDFEQRGFEWISCHDSTQSVLAYLRRSDNEMLVIVLNFTPVERYGYTIGVPVGGEYMELLNSDSEYYHGSNVGNAVPIMAHPEPWMGQPYSLDLTLPPLGAVVLKPRT